MNNEMMWLLAEKYAGKKSADFYVDCERLNRGEPLAYVIGTIPFLNTIISVDSHPLIPRPETEYWVERVITRMTNSEKVSPRVLDMCAGSGCIGVAIAKHVPRAYVDFAEVDTRHHFTISKNITENDIDVGRTQIFGGDTFDCVSDRYDYIVSNPPYIDPALDRLAQSVRDYEPAMALYGGIDGMEIISRIIQEAPAHLVTGGELWIEHEPEQVAAIGVQGEQRGFITHTQLDQYSTPRFSRLVLQY